MDAPNLTRAVRPSPTLLQAGWQGAVGRLVLAALVLVPVTLAGGHHVLRSGVPTMTQVFEALAPHLQVEHLGLVHSSGQLQMQVRVVLVRSLTGAGRAIEELAADASREH